MGRSGNPAKAAQQAREKLNAIPATPDPVDADGVVDFDQFWTQVDRKAIRVRIMGDVVELPPSIPLRFELEAKRLQRSKSDADVRRLVAILFGEDQLDRWVAAGMDAEQFQVLLAWAPMVLAGRDVTLHQVAALLAEARAAKGDDTGDPT